MRLRLLVSLAAVVPAVSATAAPRLDVEATSDLRERGLSSSDGQAALSARAGLDVTDGLGVSLRAATLRGSRRHGGADLGLDAAVRVRRDLGPWQLAAGGTRRLFVGEGRLDYWELDGGITYAIGPARLGAFASYAPDQRAIGGDNVYVEATVEVGVPGTPVTLYGGAGRSSGSVDDPVRAARLRPDGSYVDWRLGGEYVAGPLAGGLRFTSTTIGSASAGPFVDRNRGSRLAAYLRLGL